MIDLNDILQTITPLFESGHPAPLSCDTRTLTEGGIFVAIPCDSAYDYAKIAVKRGVKVIICDQDIAQRLTESSPPFSEILVVPNPRLIFSQLAAHYYPRQPETIVAVTGTNGKSSVVGFVRQLWEHLSIPSVSIGTLGLTANKSAILPSDLQSVKLTTPDALSMHQLLHRLAEEKIPCCAFEASSHGLDQYRSHNVHLKAAGFTNLTQDHLDYHISMEAYFAAKARLFTEILSADGTAVLNAASPYFSALRLLLKGRGCAVLSYNASGEGHLKASRIRLDPTKVSFDLSYDGLIWPDMSVPVVGPFQIENILCAIGLLIGSGITIDQILPFLPHLQSTPGRMQLVGKPSNGARIFVDYAHTPDALLRSLTALKAHSAGDSKIHVVFGCGGNRDTSKRSLMGEIAHAHGDAVYVTDDNPRYENPAFIRAQILTGCPNAIEISDRKQAIAHAITQLGPNDILLVAGKGHEQGQIIDDHIIPFDDVDIIQTFLQDIAR